MMVRPSRWRILLAVFMGGVRMSRNHPAMRKVIARHPLNGQR